MDGVITAELDHIPSGPPIKTGELPVDSDAEAAQKLEVAKLYLRHDMSARAVEILEEVAKSYSDTEAAKQAKLLLAALRPRE